MKFENNWKNKSLENLEKDIWDEPEYSSHLVTTCHKLRKKQLKDFDIEDLRIMIGQNIGLKFLIPLAIEKLKQNILAEGDLYEGDLLKSVLTSEPDYWKEEKENWLLICTLFNEKKVQLDYTNKDLFQSFKKFEKINGK
ncbi:contact-dependent growth inhibition system immunity protein [Lutibacter sp.]